MPAHTLATTFDVDNDFGQIIFPLIKFPDGVQSTKLQVAIFNNAKSIPTLNSLTNSISFWDLIHLKWFLHYRREMSIRTFDAQTVIQLRPDEYQTFLLDHGTHIEEGMKRNEFVAIVFPPAAPAPAAAAPTPSTGSASIGTVCLLTRFQAFHGYQTCGSAASSRKLYR